MPTADVLDGLAELAGIGRDRRRGGYARHGFDAADRELREWFAAAADRCGLDAERDRCGNLWAWWGRPGPGAVVTGSHLDSVPGGGAFDGPLGVVSALAAVEALRAAGFAPRRPLAVVVFAEEEGGRFGVPCLGSRLLAGSLDAGDALGMRDDAGMTVAEAMRSAGMDPSAVAAEPDRLAGIGAFVELHVEQGRALGAPVGLATSTVAHGRWRFRVTGQGNHAGTTALADRRDPMLPVAEIVRAARSLAAAQGALATVGRVAVRPGGTNVIASAVDVWLDARGRDPGELVHAVTAAAREAAAAEGCGVEVSRESFSAEVSFDAALTDRLAVALGDPPRLPTGAGHDAGVLATQVPAAMLFVRNPTGISHAPEEHAEDADCAAGVAALTTALAHLAS